MNFTGNNLYNNLKDQVKVTFAVKTFSWATLRKTFEFNKLELRESDVSPDEQHFSRHKK